MASYSKGRHSQNTLKLYKNFKGNGKKVAIDVDDRLDCVHKSNPASAMFFNNSPHLKNFLSCLSIADGVTCSTPEIRDAYKFRTKNQNIVAINNSIDFSDPIYSQPKGRETLDPDIKYIMWSGSSSHMDSLHVAKSAVEQVVNTYDNVKLIIGGNIEFYDIFKVDESKKIHIPGVTADKYTMMPSHGDIFITPLVLSPFNEGKSELKVLEAGIFSTPSISSPAAPYKRFNDVSGGANVIIKGNRPDRWIRELKNMIDNDEYRLDMGKRTYDAIKTHYNMELANAQRVEFWEKLLLN